MIADSEHLEALAPDPSLESSCGKFMETDDSDAETLADSNRTKTLADGTEVLDRLPPSDWRVEAQLSASGTMDKTYYHLITGRRFRSKMEVMSFLETGKRKRNISAKGDGLAQNDSQAQKSRKSATGSHWSSLAEIDKFTGEPEVDGPRVQSTLVVINPTLRKFSYSDLKYATEDFCNKIGEGDNGSVYKGYLPPAADSQVKSVPIAVKRVNKYRKIYKLQYQSLVQTSSIVRDFSGCLQHDHLAKLIGYCAEDEDLLFVYEHMSQGSVEDHLFKHGRQNKGRKQHHPFSWNLRLKVALHAAKGLVFLHDQTPSVIHGDLKPANILLDNDFNAKLSEFGLVKDGHVDGETGFAETMRVGYVPLDYSINGRLTAETDVYTFGVVLLVMLTGLQPTEGLGEPGKFGEKRLVEYVNTFPPPKWCDDKETVRKLADRMGCLYNLDGAYRLARVICDCFKWDCKLRPTIAEVMQELEYIYEHHQISEATEVTHRRATT